MRLSGDNIALQKLLYFSTITSNGRVAQWLEQGAHNALVAGSIPASPTTF
jgi:hypothetical protein